MKIALISIDYRQNERAHNQTIPRFRTGVESFIEGVSAMPEHQVHVVSCTQQRMQSPEKLAPNVWFHSLPVPKFGWMRTFYQGCVRAMRKTFHQIQPDIVYGVGTEREGAIGAVRPRWSSPESSARAKDNWNCWTSPPNCTAAA